MNPLCLLTLGDCSFDFLSIEKKNKDNEKEEEKEKKKKRKGLKFTCFLKEEVKQ